MTQSSKKGKDGKLISLLSDLTFRRGIVSIAIFLILWEVGFRFHEWFGIMVPFIGKIDAPTLVVARWSEVVLKPGYWESWYLSFGRVFFGFLVAQVVGIPFALAMAVNKYFRGMFFPPFEILRPIPPLAWVPASIIFWPTTELSIMFVTFLGAFYTIVINVLGGARSIDIQYLRAAQSMGATQWDLFRKIILPGTLPSIFIGAAVGMGITWEVVLAAEMISGDYGLGYMIMDSYMVNKYTTMVMAMLTLGFVGWITSAMVRFAGQLMMQWREKSLGQGGV